MSVSKKGKSWYIFFRPFGELVKLSLKDCHTKELGKDIQSQLLYALHSGNYAGLTPVAKEACIRLFINQKWEFPPELKPKQVQHPAKVITFWDAVKLYGKDPSFQQLSGKIRYAAIFDHLVSFFEQTKSVKDIWVSDIKQYRMHRASEGIKNATINREISTLSGIFRVLIEHQIVDANPCRSIRKLSEKDSERQVYISLEDFNRILDFIPSRYRDFLWVLYLTGLRRSEAYKLKWKHINLRSRIIGFHSVETKEAGFKRVPIHKDLVPVFEHMGKVRTLGSDSLWQWGYHAPSDPWKAAMKNLEWSDPKPRINDLRHTFKTNCRRSGIEEVISEKIMGHVERKLNVSQRYGFIDENELVNAIDKLTYDHGLTQILAVSKTKK